MHLITTKIIFALYFLCKTCYALNIVVAGGTGSIGRQLSERLTQHNVAILCRNSFLASTPARVSTDYGWLGESFLNNNAHINLRDWDAGDMLDIVGCDFLGWQEDVLVGADVVVNLVGGFTEQRTMAAERLIRESLRLNPKALQICVSPVDEEIDIKIKRDRVKKIEDMYKGNCGKYSCIRLEYNKIISSCDVIADAIGTAE